MATAACVTCRTLAVRGDAIAGNASRSARRCGPCSGYRFRRMTRQRLDTVLAQRGLFPSRSRAAAAVMAGDIRLGDGTQAASKPGQLVAEDVPVTIAARAEYVSRGGIKLANALAASGLAVEGRRALDVGSSTGGFTDCLLRHGAAAVTAVDVGYGDLDWGLRNDHRVTVLERTNARHLDGERLPYVPDLAVIDVSFISLTKVLPAVVACLAGDRFDVLALCKPQFEVGRDRVGKGGVVRDAAARRDALVTVAEFALDLGCAVVGFHSSGLPGPKGNLETFVQLAEQGRDAATTKAEDVRELALRAEA